jgi:hypothetical protein
MSNYFQNKVWMANPTVLDLCNTVVTICTSYLIIKELHFAHRVVSIMWFLQYTAIMSGLV